MTLRGGRVMGLLALVVLAGVGSVWLLHHLDSDPQATPGRSP